MPDINSSSMFNSLTVKVANVRGDLALKIPLTVSSILINVLNPAIPASGSSRLVITVSSNPSVGINPSRLINPIWYII